MQAPIRKMTVPTLIINEMKEENYTEQYRGIIMLRKGRTDDEDVWFATVGNHLVSNGMYKSKEELMIS